ncbi:HWE histidine kinase domain-containing protein [Rhizobium sp. NPDC090275]|uniref:HWE histidine kinase domain-containing protein n=1 Tax=Rhizobium sp. NPDC090275 TaxID=3364498 RepID=UPI003839E271
MALKDDELPDYESMNTMRSADPFVCMVGATRTPMVITNPNLPDNPIIYANAAFVKMTGYAESEILGKNCRFLQGLATDESSLVILKAAINARAETEVDLLNYRKDGTKFWNRLLVTPVFDERGLAFFVASQQDVTLEVEQLAAIEQRKADLEAEVLKRAEELETSEQRLRLALEAGRLGIWTIDLATSELTASTECKSICGRAPEEPLTLADLRSSIHPEDRLLQVEAIDQAIADGTPLDAEYRLVTPAGELRWVQIRGRANYSPCGIPLSITGTTQDITSRRIVQGHRALLARELSHRVKNTLTSLQAVVSQTIRRAETLDEAGSTLSARIRAMAVANDLLVTEDFGSASLRNLVTRTLAPFGVDDAARFTITGEDFDLPSHVVPAYALVLHELATNATKYGALCTDTGHIEIEWLIDSSSNGRELNLKWRESGGPRVTPPVKTSFGTQLIQRLLASEAGGVAKISYLPSGVSFTATVPMR